MTDEANPKLERSTAVVSTDIGEGTALLDLSTNNYFSLNEVGAFIWKFLATPRSRADILRAVVAEFDVAMETCASDIDQLIEELQGAALIHSEGRAG